MFLGTELSPPNPNYNVNQIIYRVVCGKIPTTIRGLRGAPQARHLVIRIIHICVGYSCIIFESMYASASAVEQRNQFRNNYRKKWTAAAWNIYTNNILIEFRTEPNTISSIRPITGNNMWSKFNIDFFISFLYWTKIINN